jgi:hypothetical protein
VLIKNCWEGVDVNKLLWGGVATMCLMAAAKAHAEAQFYGDVSLAFGGDEVAEVLVETWDDEIESVDIDSGEGLGLAVGTRFDFGSSNFDGVVTIGYKSASIFGEDGDEVGFDRFPLTAMLYYDFGLLQLGAGLSHEMNGDVDLKDAGGRSHDVDDSTGQVIALVFNIGDAVIVGARYTMIEYDIEGYLETLDGDNFAVVAGISF